MKSSKASDIAAIEPALKERFGARFPGLVLAAVEEVFWPVFNHRLNVTTRTRLPLDPFEEGLLRVLAVRPMPLADVARYLGIGVNLAARTVKRLSVGGSQAQALTEGADGSLRPTDLAGQMLETLERPQIQEKTASVFRDALFDELFALNEDSLECIAMEHSKDFQSRWLDSIVAAEWNPEPSTVAQIARTTVQASDEIVGTSFQRSGSLKWIRLHLGCFASDRGRKGRLLLFNPAEEDRPLDEISLRFEALLTEHGVPPLYHTRDALGTAEAFWKALSTPLLSGTIVELHSAVVQSYEAKAGEYEEALQEGRSGQAAGGGEGIGRQEEFRTELAASLFGASERLTLGEVKDAARCYAESYSLLIACLVRRLSTGNERDRNFQEKPIDDLFHSGMFGREVRNDLHRHRQQRNLVVHPEKRIELGLPEPTLPEVKSWVEDLGRLVQALGERPTEERPIQPSPRIRTYRAEQDRLLAEIIDLRQRIARLPEIRSLRMDEHQAVLDEALGTTKKTLIIVSPWIRLQVLQRTGILAGIEQLLRRGCEVWIGHGMPRSNFHKDSTDQEALKRLDELTSVGRLFRIGGLATHEKLLICDDLFHVITSYNWLSFDGRQARDERGTLVRGQAATAVERDEILNRLRERLRRQRVGAPKHVAATSR